MTFFCSVGAKPIVTDDVSAPLLLIDPHRHPPARQRFRGLDVTVSSLNHLAFEIAPEAYEAEKQRLETLGLKVHEGHFPHMNAKALFFQDPEGNTLEFICHDGSGAALQESGENR